MGEATVDELITPPASDKSMAGWVSKDGPVPIRILITPTPEGDTVVVLIDFLAMKT
jgi:hypothetical protein